ncbi:MAG: glycosyltransferase family 39 protein [Planctomycetes bacterium]|nr:glycosyltransferase family 39 protein [Planctomycetota bacterium]
MAELIQQGKYQEAMEFRYHPLYSALVALLDYAVSDPETAGYLISIIFSTLSVIFVYKIGLLLSSPGSAFIAGIIYIFHPSIINYHNEIMTEATFEFFFLGSAFYFLKVYKENKPLMIIPSILFFILSYMVRPDSLILPPLYLIFLTYSCFFSNDKRASLIALLILILTTSAMIVGAKKLTGKDISVKTSVSKLLSGNSEEESPTSDKLKFYTRFLKAVDPLFVILFAVSVFRIKKSHAPLLLMIGINYILLYIFYLKGGWTQSRYFTLSLVFLFYPIADNIFHSRSRIINILYLLFLLQGFYLINRWEKLDLLNCKRAGEYTLKEHGKGQIIATTRREAAYYSNGIYLDPTRSRDASIYICREAENAPKEFKLSKQFPPIGIAKGFNVYIKK